MDFKKKARQEAQKFQKAQAINDAVGKSLLDDLARVTAEVYEMEETIGRDGLQVPDRFGQLKSHPLLPALRDSRKVRLAILKTLGLDIIDTPTAGPGRPPRGY